MKALSVARKTLLEYLREPLLLGLIFFFPLMLVVFYDVAFGETDQGLSRHLKLLVLNEDLGATGDQLVGVMRAVKWEGKPLFDVVPVADRRAAEIAVRERKAALLLTIPPDFTEALSGGADGAAPAAAMAAVSLAGYPHSDNFIFARSFVDELVRRFARYADGREAPLAVTYEFLSGSGGMSDFAFGVPGVIVFGVMFVTVSTAHTLVRENVSGTLRRLRLTRLAARDLLLGVTLAQMAIALVMVPVTFGAAALLGFRGQGSLLLAVGIGLLLSLSAVGLGLLVACFARNDGEAANLSATVDMLMVLLSGAMYPVPDLPVATVAGRTVQLYDLLPTTHGAEAMRRVLVSGDGPGAILYELVALLSLSALILAAGVVLYRRLRMEA